MQHRGRHRRRRRGRALRATLAGTALALTAAATLISTSQATNANNPGALNPLTSAAELAELRLHETLTDEATLDALATGMGGTTDVRDVLRSADRTMRTQGDCSDAEEGALPVEPSATRAYCWDTKDAATEAWLPRSVTTSGDADNDGKWADDRVILSGWTHTDSRAAEPAPDNGLARIAFIDADDPKRLAYRWVLLVIPADDGTDFAAVRSRLSGMVWYQDKLIVTARSAAATTDNDDALYVFDMNRVLRTDVNSDAIGKVGDGWSAYGHEYVLPAIGSYRLTGGACAPGRTDAVPCLGSLSLDRTSTPHSLVAGEASGSDGGDRARLWRYDLSTSPDRTGLLASDPGNNVDADEAYETEATALRGVLSHGDDWYVDRAPDDRDRHGTLWRQDDSGAKAATCTADQYRACWGRHTRSLSYWPETGELWTLTGPSELDAESDTDPARVLYAVRFESVGSALG
ncbi:hypothetical protein [Streptomyces sp. NPDC002845]